MRLTRLPTKFCFYNGLKWKKRLFTVRKPEWRLGCRRCRTDGDLMLIRPLRGCSCIRIPVTESRASLACRLSIIWRLCRHLCTASPSKKQLLYHLDFHHIKAQLIFNVRLWNFKSTFHFWQACLRRRLHIKNKSSASLPRIALNNLLIPLT